MLSTSTLLSNTISPSSNRPIASHTAMSKKPGSSNPLTDLIETEKEYLETLKIIDSQIAAIWMKQTVAAAPDFSELLKYTHDIIKINKRFCTTLVTISANPQTIQELGNVLIQWIDDMVGPYTSYSKRYIPNLNQRQEIASNISIRHLLQNLSANVAQEMSLESLFDAPLHQLKYYKNMYNRLLESTDPGKADHTLLQSANIRIDAIMLNAKTHDAQHRPKAPLSSLPRIQTDFEPPGKSLFDPGLVALDNQTDCSQLVDLFSGAPMKYRLRLATPGAKAILHSKFQLLSEDGNGSTRVQLVLTTDQLAIFKQETLLMYPALSIDDVNVRSTKLDREGSGEFLIQFAVMGKKHLTMRAESREVRNVWVGVNASAPSSTTLMIRPLTNVVRAQQPSPSKAMFGQPTPQSASDKAQAEAHVDLVKSKLRNNDIFSYYSDRNGEISPLNSSDDEQYPLNPVIHHTPKGSAPHSVLSSDGQEDLNTIQPRSVKILSKLPPVEADKAHVQATTLTVQASPDKATRNEAQQETSQVQMTFIEPAMAKMTISINRDSEASLPTLPPSPSKQGSSLTHVPVRVDSIKKDTNVPPRPQPPRLTEPIRSESSQSPSSERALPSPSPTVSMRQNAPPSQGERNANPGQPTSLNSAHGTLPRTTSSQRGPASPDSPSPLRPQPNPTYMGAQRNQSIHQQQHPSYPHPQPHPLSYPHPATLSNSHPQPQPHPHLHPQHPQQHPHPMHAQQPRSPAGAPQYPPGHPMHRPPHMQPGFQGHFRPSSPQQSPAFIHRPGPPPGSPLLQTSYSSSTIQTRPPATPTPSRSAMPGGSQASTGYPSSPQRSPLKDPRQQQPGANDGGNYQVPFSNNQCEVFRWNSEDQTWNFVEGRCTLQVRLMADQRSTMTVQLQATGQLYLNAWIVPDMALSQPLATDVCVGVYMPEKETYLVHFGRPEEAEALMAVLQRLRDQSHQQPTAYLPARTTSQNDEDDFQPRSVEDAPQKLTRVLQCKCKLFAQNETSNWSHLGSVTMIISHQQPSRKFHIRMEKGNSDLISAFVKSDNVEQLSTKQITFLLKNEQERTSMVYMIQVKDKQTKDQIYKYLKQKNAEFGW